MIRHQVYFDTLGTMKEDSASWRSVFAGLSVLRLVDAYVDAGSGAPTVNWAQVHSVRAALENVAEGDPLRGVLTNLVEELISRNKVDDAVCVALLAYGRTLDYEANWALATDVFATVAKVVRPERNARLAVEANVAAGGAARRNGDWEVSARAYSQAAYVADTLGDRQGVLTVQVGIANTYLSRGNIPQAQSILDDVIVQAREQHFTDVEAIALHSRSSVAHRQGDITDAVKLAHEALRASTKASDRDFILEDLAAAFSELGLREAARDTHLLLTATSEKKWVRWQATINLMELASEDGMRDAFDSYVAQLRNEPMGPWLRAHYLIFFGEGLDRFGQAEAAQEILAQAVTFAEANQIHSATFRAEAALKAVRSANRAASTPPTFPELPGDVLAAAHSVAELRKAALVPG